MTDEFVAPIRCAGVVGLGLIGGSIARDLSAMGARVLAYDRDPSVLEMACSEGAVAEPLDASLSGLADADAVIVAVPVSALKDVLGAAPRLRAPLVTDVGSTKRSAVATAVALGLGDRFVGSHPMAGDHRSGWAASRTGLFSDARVYLCRTPNTSDDAVSRAESLWRALGASPELIAPDTHDRLLAYTSHVPQIVSTALALAIGDAGVLREQLGQGGRDATRLAGGSVDMWAAIAKDNADAMLPAIAVVEARLRRLRSAVESGDETALRALFTAGRAWSGAPVER